MNNDDLLQLHRVEIGALKELDRICGILGLKYYLVGGTLLGAVRHKGFIPWDDDLDVAMPRDDYDVFFEKAPNLMASEYFIQNCYNDRGHAKLYGKIRVNNTFFVEKISKNSVMHQGIFIDIFPLDFGNEKLSVSDVIRKRWADRITNYIEAKRYKKGFTIKQRMFCIFPDFFLNKIRDSFLKKKSGDYYLNHGSQYGLEKQTIKKSYYDPPVKLEFEGGCYYAPKDYDYILRHIYGDNYMQLPPQEKRVTHDPICLSFDAGGK